MAKSETAPDENVESQGNPEKKGGLLSRFFEAVSRQIGSDWAPLAVVVIAFGFLAFLVYGVLGRRQVIDQLSRIEYARGLITYILAVGTIAIAMIVAIGGLLARDTEAEKRFGRGKEVLTILMGVLGTIVGFYYGSQAGEAGPAEELSITAPLVSNVSPFVGEKTALTSLFRGGKPPYQYEILFENAPAGVPWRQKKGQANDLGWAVAEYELTGVKPGKLVYTIRVTDAGGSTRSYTSDDRTSLEVRAKEGEKPKTEPAGSDGNTAGQARNGRA
jgi:hypothetical protein